MMIVLITVALLLGNAFFVGAEFAAMAARRSQLEPLAEAGDVRAQKVIDAMHRTGILLATCQLGITVCSVLLGAISEAQLHHALVGPLGSLGVPDGLVDAVALAGAIFIVVYLHVVVGEMIPKNISIAGPEQSARILVPPLVAISRLIAPIIHAMDWVSKLFVRAMGVEPKDEVSAAFTAQEVAHIVDESHREGLVQADQHARIDAALEFSDKEAADVAVPTGQLVGVRLDATPDDLERQVARHGFSRYPVINDAIAGEPGAFEMVGYLHLKDVLYADEAERAQPIPRKRVRALATVAPNDEVEEVLATMQRTGAHLARVVDAAGQLTGVVFLEDVIEELVGEVSG